MELRGRDRRPDGSENRFELSFLFEKTSHLIDDVAHLMPLPRETPTARSDVVDEIGRDTLCDLPNPDQPLLYLQIRRLLQGERGSDSVLIEEGAHARAKSRNSRTRRGPNVVPLDRAAREVASDLR